MPQSCQDHKEVLGLCRSLRRPVVHADSARALLSVTEEAAEVSGATKRESATLDCAVGAPMMKQREVIICQYQFAPLPAVHCVVLSLCMPQSYYTAPTLCVGVEIPRSLPKHTDDFHSELLNTTDTTRDRQTDVHTDFTTSPTAGKRDEPPHSARRQLLHPAVLFRSSPADNLPDRLLTLPQQPQKVRGRPRFLTPSTFKHSPYTYRTSVCHGAPPSNHYMNNGRSCSCTRTAVACTKLLHSTYYGYSCCAMSADGPRRDAASTFVNIARAPLLPAGKSARENTPCIIREWPIA